ncbi:MAG: methylated-DNA--[protein]-cysteine S-methyltransferase [Roseiflexaceae bacterium]
MNDTISIATIATPLGNISAASSLRGLVYLGFGERARILAEAWARRWLPDAALLGEQPAPPDLAAQIAAYFTGELREWSLALDLRGTPFQIQAWRALCQIPYGTTRAYSEHAAVIGHPRAVRAVGAANGANPISLIVPCHRLIGKDGALVKYGGGLDIKRRLLELEGALGSDARHAA